MVCRCSYDCAYNNHKDKRCEYIHSRHLPFKQHPMFIGLIYTYYSCCQVPKQMKHVARHMINRSVVMIKERNLYVKS